MRQVPAPPGEADISSCDSPIAQLVARGVDNTLLDLTRAFLRHGVRQKQVVRPLVCPRRTPEKARKDKLVAEREPRRIPSDEDFERASAAMAERMRGLDTVSANVFRRFQQVCPNSYGFYVLWQGEPTFRAYFFTEGRGAVDEFADSNHYIDLQKLVHDELAAAGRGSRDEITVEFSVQDRRMYAAK